MKKIKLCRVTTVPFAMVQLKAQLEYLSKNGFSVSMVTSADDGLLSAKADGVPLFELSETLTHTTIEIPRSIQPWKDLKSIYHLFWFFRKHQFDIVHSMTPKAGLVSAIAGFLARVPVRLHSFTGQTWLFETGFVRFATRASERLIGWLNTKCYADSKNQAKFLCAEGLIAEEKLNVVLEGSIAGVDLSRFDPEKLHAERLHKRKHFEFSDREFCLVFVGRKTRDKGIFELISAFKGAYEKHPELKLVLIGPSDKDESLAPLLAEIKKHPGILDLGFVDNIEAHMAMGDALCLPSYREGFSGVVLQAAALGMPILGTDIYGINDFVEHEKQGLLVPARNAESLQAALILLIENSVKTKLMGASARKKLVEFFDAELLNKAFAEEYRKLSSARGLI